MEMIIEGLAAAAVAKAFYDVNKSMKMDEKTLQKYAKAFEKQEEAALLLRSKEEFTDKRLANVAKKKRAIIQNTVPRFVDVYGKIQKIELESKTKVNEITAHENIGKLNTLQALSVSVKKQFSDKELVCGYLMKGIPGLMVMDSERFMSAANNQMRSANVVYSQAQSVAEVYDAIVARADRIARLLVSMNVLFNKSIEETERVIEKNGLNVKNYTDFEKGVLMTCVNIACAVSDIIDIPVVDDKGKMYDSAVEMIETGEKYLLKMNQALNA